MTDFTLAEAQRRDAADPLAFARARFDLPEGIIYLDGNSLGALPRATASAVSRVVGSEWGQSLITSWNRHDWIALPQRLGAKIAPLIGAGEDEVIVADTTSTNLFKLIAAALAARPDRSVILSESGNFPTDLYIAQGVVAMRKGALLKAVPATKITAAIDEDVAVVLLTHVHYKSGRIHDMAAITAAAHAQGALVIWDLSHSTGAVSVDLNGCDSVKFQCYRARLITAENRPFHDMARRLQLLT